MCICVYIYIYIYIYNLWLKITQLIYSLMLAIDRSPFRLIYALLTSGILQLAGAVQYNDYISAEK